MELEAIVARELVGQSVAEVRLGHAGYLTLLIGQVYTAPGARHPEADLVLWIRGADWRIRSVSSKKILTHWHRPDEHIERFTNAYVPAVVKAAKVHGHAKLDVVFGDYHLKAVPRPPYEDEWMLFRRSDAAVILPSLHASLVCQPSGAERR